MLNLFGDMARLPLIVLLFAARQMVETAGTLGAGGGGCRRHRRPATAMDSTTYGPVEANDDNRPAAPAAPAAFDLKEDRDMGDTNLSDDDIKLVQYAIVNIGRRSEKILSQPKGAISRRGAPTARPSPARGSRSWSRATRTRSRGSTSTTCASTTRCWPAGPESDLKFEEKSLDIEEEKLGYLRKMAGKG